ncbi:MAG: NosD domain-containing protein, partial [Candidatus Jordarchaeaceae archaeon]
MRSIKTWKKLKMLFFASILLTATTILVISIHNQNTCPIINPYLLRVSQGSSAIHEKTLYISSDYNFTGNVYETIVVEMDNIVIDGKGYTLKGSGSGCGFNLTSRSNVTIKNVIVKGWMVGFYLENSSNNTLLSNTVINGGNTQSGRNIGFHLVSSSNNTLSGNKANNNGWGFVLDSSSNNTLLNNTARDNYYSGFYLGSGLY